MARLDTLESRLQELTEERNAALTELDELVERDDTLEGEDAERWTELTARFETLETEEIPAVERDLAQVRAIVDAPVREAHVATRRIAVPGVDDDPFDAGREFAPPAEIRDMARRAIERTDNMTDDHRAATEVVLRSDDVSGKIARRIVATGRPAYRSAFAKVMSNRADELDVDERSAIAQMRAASLTDTAGGYGIPFLLDPTVIDTGTHNGLAQSIRSLARTVTGTSDVWQGISSAGVTAEWLGEADEAADAAPTLAQPSITAHKGSVFVPYSVEIGGDWSGMETAFRDMISVAKSDLEEQAFTTGSGSGQPKGIVTALSGSYEESSATSDVFAGPDLYTLHDAVAARYRQRATWLANIAVISAIRKFDTDGGSDYKIEPGLTAGQPATLLGRPLVEAPYMSSAITTDAADILILADMNSAFYIYDRVGMSVEPVNHLFGSQGRPTGERGLWAWFRVGSDLVNSTAARLLTLS